MPDFPTERFPVEDAVEGRSAPGSAGGRPLGRYRVGRRLGTGGFSRVYLAHDPELELDVAIKVLKPELATEEETVERFRREASTAARLRHPHVVTVLTVGRLESAFDGAVAGTPYLVMDFLPASLAARVAAVERLPEGEVLRVGEEVARGLGYAHRQGVVHRDVKPDNVLFAHDGRAVVTDFGIARAVQGGSTVPSRQVVLGTPSYFSPEQARGLPLDGRSDIYSLGVTLYQMATGTLPFAGDDWYAVMRQHVEAAPPPPRALVPTLSPALEAVILRALAKAPEDRFPTADALADALAALRAAAADGETIGIAALPPAAPPARRRRGLVVAGALLATLAGGTIALRVLQQDAGARTRERLAPSGADSLAAVEPPTVLPVPVDSAPLAGARADSSAILARGPAALVVQAPPGAVVTLDGVRVARGDWEGDSLPPGRHVLAATVASEPGCATASVSESVTLAPGDRRIVRLRPAGCGRLLLDVAPTPARFTLVRQGGGAAAEGMLPLGAPLLLPEGRYQLRVEARFCAPFDDEVVVQPSGTVRSERVRLLCN